MIHPHTELRYIDDIIGYGVVANRQIPKGTITWVADELDQHFTPEQVVRMSAVSREVLATYGFIDSRGDCVLCWDHGRFVNHSCEPNCLAPGLDMELAVRDILPGEELTDDYGTLNPEVPFICRRGCRGCRKVIAAEDLLAYGAAWDAAVASAWAVITTVDQPLWRLVQQCAQFHQALADPTALPSCRNLYFQRPGAGPLDESGSDTKSCFVSTTGRPPRSAERVGVRGRSQTQ
jgi:uncharacterized protein